MAGRKSGNHRMKPKKGLNRYDPNNPNYKAAHADTRANIRRLIGPFSLFGAMLRQR